METITQTDRQRIIKRMMQDHDMTEVQATVTFGQTLAFLVNAASRPSERSAPGLEVDKGWHTFLLYTKAYRQFCRGLGREFIDHEPDDVPGQARMDVRDGQVSECTCNCVSNCGSVSCDAECLDVRHPKVEARTCFRHCSGAVVPSEDSHQLS